MNNRDIDIEDIRDIATPPTFAAKRGTRSPDQPEGKSARIEIKKSDFAFGSIAVNWSGKVSFTVRDAADETRTGGAAVWGASFDAASQSYTLIVGRKPLS